LDKIITSVSTSKKCVMVKIDLWGEIFGMEKKGIDPKQVERAF
jgi:hypothetical protein